MIKLDKQWPIKILLVHPKASFLNEDKFTIAADCVTLSNEKLANKFKNGETVIIGCPLLEDPDRLAKKLYLIIENTSARQVEVYTMEVPCCHAIHMMVMKAISDIGKKDIDSIHYIVRVATGKAEYYKPGVIDESMLEAERKSHDKH